MPQCPKCRDMVAPGETYCPNCGTPVPPEPEMPEGFAQLSLSSLSSFSSGRSFIQ